MKHHITLSAIALASITALAVAGSAQATPLRTAEAAVVTADIRVELDLPTFDSLGPMVFEVIGVPVNDQVELPAGSAPVSNPTNWSGDISVDIAADLSTVTVTGGIDSDWFEEAYVRITLHGGTWGELETVTNDLFAFAPAGQFESLASGAGNGTLGSVLTFDYPLVPDLQTTNVSGGLFEAYWRGQDTGLLNGTATFYFAAPAAVPVDAEPTFTG